MHVARSHINYVSIGTESNINYKNIKTTKKCTFRMIFFEEIMLQCVIMLIKTQHNLNFGISLYVFIISMVLFCNHACLGILLSYMY